MACMQTTWIALTDSTGATAQMWVPAKAHLHNVVRLRAVIHQEHQCNGFSNVVLSNSICNQPIADLHVDHDR